MDRWQLDFLPIRFHQFSNILLQLCLHQLWRRIQASRLDYLHNLQYCRRPLL